MKLKSSNVILFVLCNFVLICAILLITPICAHNFEKFVQEND